MQKNITHVFILITIIFSYTPAVFSLTLEQEAEALNIGKKMIFEGNIDEGIKTLEEAVGQGNNMNILLYLGKAYSWKGNYAKALEYYTRVQSLTKNDDASYWLAQFGIAQVTSWQKKFGEAIVLYEQIITEYKKIPVFLKRDTYIAIGDVYSWKLEISRAIEYFNKALEVDPKSVTALNRIAKVYLWSKNYKESKKYCLKALEVDKNDLEARNRIASLDLLWDYSVTIGNTLTLYDAKNTKGESVKRNATKATFDWPVRENLGLHFESTFVMQNSVETSDPEEASKWTSDVNAGAGINGKIMENTYYTFLYNYAFNAKLLPDWTGEADLSQKITTNFDILLGYKIYYNSQYKEQKKQSPSTHSISGGAIFYISEFIYSQVQLFYDTDGKDRLFSILFHQTFTLTPRDKIDIYLSYGKGMNYLIYTDTTVPVTVTTTGISLSYVHFFSSRFGLNPTVEYHDRANYYSDISFGLQAIYNI